MDTLTEALSAGMQMEGEQKRRFLNTQQIAMIDEALQALGDFGEVRLLVEKGRLRFIVTQKSYDVFKWRPGEMTSSRR
ncbi:MAG: hypothetical protein Fur0018_08010 [Anaerolineales bacterium]